MEAWVYILLCADGSYYVGSTTKLDLRLQQHNDGVFSGYTSTRLPVQLAWNSRHDHISDAIVEEQRLKKWSRAKKLALIEGRYDDLPGLASRSRKAAPPDLSS